jgi:hypothetical protein
MMCMAVHHPTNRADHPDLVGNTDLPCRFIS